MCKYPRTCRPNQRKRLSICFQLRLLIVTVIVLLSLPMKKRQKQRQTQTAADGNATRTHEAPSQRPAEPANNPHSQQQKTKVRTSSEGCARFSSIAAWNLHGTLRLQFKAQTGDKERHRFSCSAVSAMSDFAMHSNSLQHGFGQPGDEVRKDERQERMKQFRRQQAFPTKIENCVSGDEKDNK